MRNKRLGVLDSFGGSILALLLLVHAFGGCTTVGSAGIVSKIVDCTKQAIRDKAAGAIAQVNDVLGNLSISNDESRTRLIQLGIDAGEDVIGCVLADQSLKFGESATANPGDRVSQVASLRSHQRLAELEGDGWQFNR